MSTLPFTAVLKATLESVVEVILICGGGYLLASSGILDKPSQRSLSKANLYFFTPSLIFAKLGGQLRWTVIKNLWAIPLLVASCIGTGFVVAKIGSRILRLNRQWEKFVIACTIFQNTNAPPIAIIMSLSQTLASALYCPLITRDSADKVASRGILYLLITSQLTLVIRWSYGYRVLLAPDPPSDPPQVQPNEATERTPLKKSSRRESARPSDLQSDYYSTGHLDGQTSISEPIVDRRSLHSASQESLTSFPALSIRSTDAPSSRLKWTILSSLRQAASLMNPPLWAVLASVIVALIPPLQNQLFFKTESFLHNSLFLAIDTTGAVAIPLILVSLGSSLPKSLEVLESATLFPTDPKMERRGIFMALFGRMALVPLLLSPFLIATMHYGIKNNIGILSDPIFWVVVFLIVGTPVSLQMSQITQIHGIWDRELAKVLWWGYAVFSIPCTMIGVIMSLELLKWCRE